MKPKCGVAVYLREEETEKRRKPKGNGAEGEGGGCRRPRGRSGDVGVA